MNWNDGGHLSLFAVVAGRLPRGDQQFIRVHHQAAKIKEKIK